MFILANITSYLFWRISFPSGTRYHVIDYCEVAIRKSFAGVTLVSWTLLHLIGVSSVIQSCR